MPKPVLRTWSQPSDQRCRFNVIHNEVAKVVDVDRPHQRENCAVVSYDFYIPVWYCQQYSNHFQSVFVGFLEFCVYFCSFTMLVYYYGVRVVLLRNYTPSEVFVVFCFLWKIFQHLGPVSNFHDRNCDISSFIYVILAKASKHKVLHMQLTCDVCKLFL